MLRNSVLRYKSSVSVCRSLHLAGCKKSQSVTLLEDIKSRHPPSPDNQPRGFADFLPSIPPDGHKLDFVMRRELEFALFPWIFHTEFNILP